MGYDSLYRKYRNRKEAIEKYKITDVILCITAVIVIPTLTALIVYLITKRVNYLLIILMFAGTVVFSVSNLINNRRNGYRYVHCSHNAGGTIKSFEAEHGKGAVSYGEIRNDGTVFKYTLSNDARVNCSVDFGEYTFTVLNDEWDEVKKFKAEKEEDFEPVMSEALDFAASLEKKPGGEYDETLQPEVESDEYEEDCEYEEEDDGEEDEEDKEQ